ncbi:protein kinase domain-containing protein [Nonomuraea sp. KM88]|uniref:protein kinase domain-containing protein n=1 Tax=Nonomuraea sp. KM88 TaxID=3457427 RepID=UPI003FCE4574
MNPPGDRYRMSRPAGERAFIASDRQLLREVLIREVPSPPELPGSERDVLALKAVQRARAASRISHPALNPLLDAYVADGAAWLVSEPIDGMPLAQAVRERGPLPAGQVTAIATDVLGALAAGHALGLAHLGVRPDTVWLTASGRGVLTGYGCAVPELFGGGSGGTPGFTAPECLSGTGPAPASDLWSLGATLYLAVEGVPAFPEGGLATVSAVLAGEPRPPVRARALAPLLLALLARDPARRPAVPAALDTLRGGGQRPALRLGGGMVALSAAGLSLVVAAPAVAVTLSLSGSPGPAPRTTYAPVSASSAASTAGSASPAATAPVGTSPSATATPGGAAFASIPRPCSRLTEEQARELVPGYTKSPLEANECSWSTLDDGKNSIILKAFLMKPGPLGDGTAVAREYVIGMRQEAASMAGPSAVGGRELPPRDLPGVGDLAAGRDKVSSWAGDNRLNTEVWFHVRNLAILLRCERDVPSTVTADTDGSVRKCAETAARHVAEGLT